MFTPRQQAYYDKLKDRPAFQLAVDTFDLVPVETAEYRRNVEIGKRVNLMIDQIEQAPKEKRKVIKARSPFENPDLSWVKDGEVPF